MKKLLICITFAVLFVSGHSHATPIIKIAPALIDPDETPTFDILIEDVSDFGAFQFDLVYDGSVVTVDSVLFGDFLGITGRDVWELPVGNAHDTLSLGAFSVYVGEDPAPEGPNGNGSLATVTLSLKSGTDTTLDFDENKSYITDTAGNALAAQWIGAEIAICTCRLTITADPGGTVRSDGAAIPSGETMTMTCGTEQPFEIEPETCHDVSDITADGDSLGAVSSHTFRCTDDGDYAMHAAFSATQPYTMETDAGEGGSISPSGDVSVSCGSDRRFDIRPLQTPPEQCHHITGVFADGQSVTQYLETDDDGVTFYTFGDVMADHTLTASFALNDYRIEASAGPGGSITPSGTVSVPCGDQTFIITPDPGYHIEDVQTDGSSQGQVGTYAFTNITGNHNIHATFTRNPCVIKASAEGNGKIVPSGDVTATCESDRTFSITPDDCHDIKYVTVNGESADPVNSYTFQNITDGETIRAVFEEKVYHITTRTNDGGTILPPGDVTGQCTTGDCVMTVKCGEDMCLTITPDECRHIADVKIDGDSVGMRESYCFTNLTGDHTIEAVFATDIHTVTATSEGCGSIDPPGNTNLECGTDQRFTITPEPCCILEDVRVNGKSAGPVTEYTFENVTSDHHRIHAVFAEAPPVTIKTVAGEGGSISPADATMECGTGEKCLTITPDECYHIADVTADDISVGTADSHCFEDATSDHTIRATFAKEPGDVTGNGILDLADAVSALKLLCDVDIGEGNAAKCADVSGDEKIGMEEVIYILIRVSEGKG